MKQQIAPQPNTNNAPAVPKTSVALDLPARTLSVHEPMEAKQARWTIDDVLEKVMHQPIRVAAEAFAPVGATGPSPRLILTRDLVLPDNTPTDGLPVFFEGVLLEVTRQIGVVHVRLGPPPNLGTAAEGWVLFRESVAVILRGPAIVRLAIPFQIERLPDFEQNYWLDLRLPRAQFLLRFGRER